MDYAAVIKLATSHISNFNPAIYSIDTYSLEHIESAPHLSSSEKQLLHEILYGWYRDKDVLDIFIKNFYTDQSAFVLRIDMNLFAVLAYLALYSIEKHGIAAFKQIIYSQDITKMYYFCSYLFDSNSLLSCLRADWMKVRDLEYVENILIGKLESLESELKVLCDDLQQKALGQAQADADKGTVVTGVTKQKSVPLTRPMSPKISKAHPRPVPERNDEQDLTFSPQSGGEVPDFSRKTLASIEADKAARKDLIRRSVEDKYDPSLEFVMNVTKGGKPVEALRNEIEEQRAKELAFDSKYCNPAPDFEKIPAKIRVNAASILREDALIRKQQAKDAQLLRHYEAELRDANEFYAWQQQMKELDTKTALDQVELRRDQAKQSAEEARNAILRGQEDNKAVADLLREQAKIIKRQKELDEEVVRLRNKEIAQGVMEVRDTMPKQAVEKVLQSKEDAAKKLRLELEEARRLKEEQDRAEEAIKADRTRQLKALNSVLKKHVTVFDPTEIAGEVFLDEMSYLEMKERVALEKARAEALEEEKRREIVTEKQKKAKELEDKALSVMRAREVKATASKLMRSKKKTAEQAAIEEKKAALERSTIGFSFELAAKKEAQLREKEQLIAEQERASRVVQFAGASKESQAVNRERELALAQARQAKQQEQERLVGMRLDAQVRRANHNNKQAVTTVERKMSIEDAIRKQTELLKERTESAERIKSEILRKKAMNILGQKQHQRTKEVTHGANLYAVKVSQADVEYGRSLAATKRTSSA